MSNRVTNQEAKAFALRQNAFGKALKNPSHGGPITREYIDGIHDGDFKATHPRYPDYAYPDDQEEDTRVEKKIAATRWFGATPQLQLTERDMDYLERKKEAQQLLKFKSFVEDSVPRGTPWAKEYFEKLMPGWYESKIAVINEKVDLVQKFVDITIRGPQSIDDMFLLYNLYQGNIKLPESFADLIRPESSILSDKTFHSGLFNPRRYLDQRILVARRNQEFLANFSIPGVDGKGIAAHNDGLATWNDVAWLTRATRMTAPGRARLAHPGNDDADLDPEGARLGFFPGGFGNQEGADNTGGAGGQAAEINWPARLSLGTQATHRGNLAIQTA